MEILQLFYIPEFFYSAHKKSVSRQKGFFFVQTVSYSDRDIQDIGHSTHIVQVAGNIQLTLRWSSTELHGLQISII